MNAGDENATSDHGGGSVSEPILNLVAHTDRNLPSGSSGEQKSGAQSNENKSFSEALKKRIVEKAVFPKKDQAIVLTSLTGISIKDYIVNLGSIIGPKNIIFASKISHSRVCVYLSSKECVDNFMVHHGGITIGDVYLSARRLITPATRIVLSNVSPIIPHEVIESTLRSSNLRVVSPVSFVGVGLGLPEYNHVFSFRRQVYIVLNENKDLPSSLVVTHEDESYRIFLSTDEVRCFICKNTGHISKECPNLNVEFPVIPTGSRSANDNTTGTDGNEQDPNLNNEMEDDSSQQDGTSRKVTTGLKRVASTEPPADNQKRSNKQYGQETSDDEEIRSFPTSHSHHERTTSKRLKASKAELELAFEPLRKIFEKKAYVLNFDEFRSFMKRVKGSSEPRNVALTYTKEIPQLVQMLEELHPFVEVRSLKERCRRLTVSLIKGRRSSSMSSLASELSD